MRVEIYKTAKKQAFIAITFQKEAKSIQAAIEKGVLDAKYSPMVINQKEHNNQIVPEIFYVIDQSRFLVMDVTYPNNGAYYEAGYARGKGKPVIICCNEQSLNAEKDKRPHFDIAQQSMVVWKDEDDLTDKLTKRIIATEIAKLQAELTKAQEKCDSLAQRILELQNQKQLM